MKNKTISYTVFSRARVLASLALVMLIASPAGYGQTRTSKALPTHLAFQVNSAEIIRFPKPIQLGIGKRKIEYKEALILSLDVRQKDYEALPPSIEPFLYIGSREYRIFSVQRAKTKGVLTLTFHIRDWAKIRDKSPMILTILHGEPVRNPKIFSKYKSPVFNKSIIKDKRK